MRLKKTAIALTALSAAMTYSAPVLRRPSASPVAPASVRAGVRFSPRAASVAGAARPEISLDGTWRFNPKGKAAAGWSKIRVPGDWTMQGFEVAPGTAASYATDVEIPADWRGLRIKLRCDGVQSDARIEVNGRPAGEHQGGFTAFERDITALVRPGASNTIALDVTNESLADTLASGTQYANYQFGGITRKIYLQALPATNLAALRVEIGFDDDGPDARLTADFEVANEGPAASADLEAVFSLADAADRTVLMDASVIVLPALAPGETRRAAFAAAVRSPKAWDDEHPNLHVLTVILRCAAGPIETVRRTFGFRTVEVVGNQAFVNGRPIKIRGANRHETHPLLGRTLSPELWRKDAELFRAANVNYIRTSHYPPAEEFLDACDELGLFVECEAPLVWINHGANGFWKNEDSDSPRFLPLIRNAIEETIEFNRAHPSIIFWSLANESGWGPNFVEAKKAADALDPTRPKTFHDQAIGAYNNRGSGAMPVANYHYPSEALLDDLSAWTRPVLFGEYAHLNCYNRRELAADPGVRDEYGRGLSRIWEKMYGAPAVLGGAIWAGINDIFYLPSGKTVGYGDWGLIDGWRREKPEYWHVKKAYSPVKMTEGRLAVPAAGAPLRLQITNRHDFTNLSEVGIAWSVGGERGTAAMDLPPRQSGILKIRPKTADLDGKTLRLDFTSPRGFLIDSYELPIGAPAPVEPPFPKPAAAPLRMRTETGTIAVEGGSFAWVFDRATGALVRAEAGGKPVVIGGPAFMLLAQDSGPCLPDYTPDAAPLNDICSGWTADSVQAKEDGGTVLLSVKGGYKEAAGGYTIRLDGAGGAAVDYEFSSGASLNPRQYGFVFYLPRACDTLTWKRIGQWSVYPTDHIGRPEGSAKAVVPGGEFAFRKPPQVAWKDDMNALGTADFRSTKASILWSALTAADGRGLLAVSDGRHATRAFLDKDRVGFLVADFNTGGGDMFYAGHHKAFDRPFEKGGAIKGSFKIRLVAPAPPASYPDGLYAEVTTNKGPIVLALEFEKTPMTVASYVGLAEGTIRNAALPDGTRYFDGTAWHRVVAGHVIQCGIPANGKASGPGYQFPNEILLPELNHGRAGMVTMANGGPHTNASQWCITLGDRSYLDGDYTVFGHVVKGMDVVMSIVQGDVVETVRIVRVGAAAQAFRPTTASFQKMVEAARIRVKEADEKKEAGEKAMVAGSWPGARSAANGVTYVVAREGTGRALAPGDKVKVAYSGRTLYGRTFVGTAPDGKPYWGATPEPFVFEIGTSKINPGLEAALAAMRAGERRTVIVPAGAGYGTGGYYAPQRPGEKRFVLSPNTRLVYDVEVLEIVK